MKTIPDQRLVWERKHAAGDHEDLRHKPSPLSKIAAPYFPPKAKILELGCGVGRDAVYFSKRGHKVIATDGSSVVIEQDKDHFADTPVQFLVLDMQKELPYEGSSFDVVYANLSLHYYSHRRTEEIISGIYKVLKDKGFLAFACKSIDDFHHGNGVEVEKNIFVAPNGHVRHLFSISYVKQLLWGRFIIEHLDEVEEDYNGEKSNIVRCIARANKTQEQV